MTTYITLTKLCYANKMNQNCAQCYNLNNPPISNVFHKFFTKPTDGTGCLIVPNSPDVQVKTPIFMVEPWNLLKPPILLNTKCIYNSCLYNYCIIKLVTDFYLVSGEKNAGLRTLDHYSKWVFLEALRQWKSQNKWYKNSVTPPPFGKNT